MRKFNVTGLCVPEDDYMVDISGKIEQIKKLVDDRCYFTINRARQYGKTTTLACLERALAGEYLVASISFEGLDDECFASSPNFGKAFLKLVSDALAFTDAPDEYKQSWLTSDIATFPDLSAHITKMCRDKKVVLMIDEVDKISNNRVFIHFLGMLRNKFLLRKNRKDQTFHSVILAGVYDITYIKLKMTDEGTYEPGPNENALYNSPWNIAAAFNVDMSFSPAEIATILTEYESDHNTGMDIRAIASEIYSYTGGYPFLVTWLCMCIDVELKKDWTAYGVQNAVQIILLRKNTLFEHIFKNLENNQKLYDFLYNLLFIGRENGVSIYDPIIDLGLAYGFIQLREHSKATVANRIFEICMYDYFISKNSTSNKPPTGILQHDIVNNGRFDMELCLRKFAEHYAEVWSGRDAEFIEREGRLLFLSYLKPLINGQGFYHIESQFTDSRRMDIVVNFGREQFIIELKLWRGEAGHDKAYEQLLGYMSSMGASSGYLLTFDFRKGVTKQPYVKWVEFGDLKIFDVVV